MHELNRDVLRVGARTAGAEHYELAAPVEPDGHGMACLGDRARLRGQIPRRPGSQLEQAAGLGAVWGSPPRCTH
jgi:hypothetical protein